MRTKKIQISELTMQRLRALAATPLASGATQLDNGLWEARIDADVHAKIQRIRMKGETIDQTLNRVMVDNAKHQDDWMNRKPKRCPGCDRLHSMVLHHGQLQPDADGYRLDHPGFLLWVCEDCAWCSKPWEGAPPPGLKLKPTEQGE